MTSQLMSNRGNKNTDRTGTTVSRKLRAAGWNISPSARKYSYPGIYVSAQGASVTILVDLSSSAENYRVAMAMSGELIGWGGAAAIRVSDSAAGARFVRFTYAA